MNEQDSTEGFLITQEEIAAINAARDALEAIGERAGRWYYTVSGVTLAVARDTGYLAGFASHAHDALFDVLNAANSHLRVGLTDQQLHNRSAGAATAAGREDDRG